MKRLATLASSLAVLAMLGTAGFTYMQKGPTPSDLEGKAAPEIALGSFKSKPVKLSEQKGNVVLIDFWATWCPPCRESLPHVQKLSEDKEMADKGLVVWAVNAREDAQKIAGFMQENNYSFSVPMDKEGAAMKSYHVSGIPTTIIVGRDGTVKKAFVGFGGEKSAKEIKDAVEAALKEEKPTA